MATLNRAYLCAATIERSLSSSLFKKFPSIVETGICTVLSLDILLVGPASGGRRWGEAWVGSDSIPLKRLGTE